MTFFSEWFEPDEVPFVHPINEETAEVPPGGSMTKPQWISDGSGGFIALDGISEPDHQAVVADLMNGITGTPGGSPSFATLRYDTNFMLLSHQLWSDHYNDDIEMEVGILPVVDDDGSAWRIEHGPGLRDQWEAANPGLFAIGIEWEGEEGLEQLGSHRSRQLVWNYLGTQGRIDGYTVTEPPFPIRQDFPISPPEGMREFKVKMKIAERWRAEDPFAAPMTYSGTGQGTRLAEDLNWKVGQVNFFGYELGLLDSYYNPPEVRLEIPDSVFNDFAELLTHETNGRQSRGFVVMGIPQLENILPAARYDGDVYIENPSLMSIYQPPRYRIRFTTAEETDYLRTFPRDDSLAGGAGRNYPHSRAVQSSNRTSGYL